MVSANRHLWYLTEEYVVLALVDPDHCQRSWMMFHLLNLDVGWMQLDPGQWAQDLRFLCFQSYKENLTVVIDTAEKAFKDVVEFATNFQDTSRQNDMIKVVKSHRELFDFKTLNKIEIADI